MKKTFYTLAFSLCLVGGFACNEATETEETTVITEEPEVTAAEDTNAVSTEVPKSLESH